MRNLSQSQVSLKTRSHFDFCSIYEVEEKLKVIAVIDLLTISTLHDFDEMDYEKQKMVFLKSKV